MNLSQSFSTIRSKVRKLSMKSAKRPGWAKLTAKTADPTSRYNLGALVAEGGFGSVYRARRRRRWYTGGLTDQIVAVKICRIEAEERFSYIDSGESLEFDGDEDDEEEETNVDGGESEEIQSRNTTKASTRTRNSGARSKLHLLKRDEDATKTIETEVNIMRRLRSPYMVRLVESFELPNGRETWIVMEFVAVTLNIPLDQNKMTQRLNRIIAAGVLQGLKYLRAKRIIHRDIKVENVMISATGWVKLCDFGCSVQLAKGEESTCVDSVKGTFQYMAPELFILGESYDYAVDIWSLGQLLYALCFGEPNVKRNGFYDASFWGNYRKSLAHYYRRLLGSAFLYPDEVAKFGKEIDLKMYRRRHKAYGALVPFLRSCAVPYPATGPRRDIKIKSALKRATLAELEESEYLNSLKCSELKQRQELVRLVAECEETESMCVDYASI